MKWRMRSIDRITLVVPKFCLSQNHRLSKSLSNVRLAIFLWICSLSMWKFGHNSSFSNIREILRSEESWRKMCFAKLRAIFHHHFKWILLSISSKKAEKYYFGISAISQTISQENVFSQIWAIRRMFAQTWG